MFLWIYFFVHIELWLSFCQKHFASSLFVTNGRFHFSSPTDFLAFRSMRMLFGHNWNLIWSQNQSTLALVLRTANASPIRTTIFTIQIIVDNNQRMAALTINEIQTLKNGNRKKNLGFHIRINCGQSYSEIHIIQYNNICLHFDSIRFYLFFFRFMFISRTFHWFLKTVWLIFFCCIGL